LDGPTPVDRVCDDGGEDELAEAGSILVTGLEPGDYAVSVAPPAGFATPEPQAVAVQPGEAATALFVLAAAGPEVGTLEILAEGPDGQPVGGACFNLAGPAAGPVCDDDDGDTNDEAGRIVLDDLPAGDYAVSVGRAPVGFSGGGDAQEATVAAGETATVTFAFDPAPTGTILVTVERGQGIEGGFCVDSLNGAVPGTPSATTPRPMATLRRTAC
jgi:uncharacterized surface anchored protein